MFRADRAPSLCRIVDVGEAELLDHHLLDDFLFSRVHGAPRSIAQLWFHQAYNWSAARVAPEPALLGAGRHFLSRTLHPGGSRDPLRWTVKDSHDHRPQPASHGQ